MTDTQLDPARLDRFSIPSLALMQARKDARDLADRRWKAVEQRISADGAADRAVLGIPNPEPPRKTSLFEVFGAMVAAFENMADQYRAGYKAARAAYAKAR